MIERVTDYPGYLIRFSPDKPTDKSILLLHGFPGARGVKNLDLADHLCRHLQQNIYILHYRGLGESRGVFRHTESIREALAVLKKISDSSQNVQTVIGHSWGGLVATNLAHQAPALFRNLILLSPFCYATREDPLYEWMIDGVQADWPGIYGNLSRVEVERELAAIGDKHFPTIIAPEIDTQVAIAVIQSSSDDTTPAARTKEFCSKLRNKPLYIELDLDHSFSENRLLLANTISDTIVSLQN